MSPLSSLLDQGNGLTSADVEAGNGIEDLHLIPENEIQIATSSSKATDRSHHQFAQSAILLPVRSTAHPSTSCEDSGVTLVRRKPRHGQDCSPPSLFLLCLESVALNIKHVESLRGLPADIVLMLFWGIIRLGLLTEGAVKLFLHTNHEEVVDTVRRMRMKSNPHPVLPTRCGKR